jgi:hypothetical protein
MVHPSTFSPTSSSTSSSSHTPSHPSPLAPPSYRRQSRNVTETSQYGLLENEEGGNPIGTVKAVKANESYAEGGDEMGDLGGGTIMLGELERRRREKGKARMTDVESCAEEDDEGGNGEDRFPPELGDEEEREEKRVADVRRSLCLSAPAFFCGTSS